MKRTTFTLLSPSTWFSAIAFVLMFGLAGMQQAFAQVTLIVSDASGGQPPAALNFTPPEGDCGVNLQWSAFVFDQQGGPATVTATITNNNLGVFPSASVVPTANGQSYGLEILAAVGTNVLTITGTGASGSTSQTYTITVNDVRVPEIYAPNTITLEVPGCDADGLVPLNYSYSVVDDCDIQPAVTVTGPPSGSLVGANTTVTITAVDDSGNQSSRTINVVVTVQPNDDPVLVVSGNGQYTVPACEDDVFVIFSGTIIDCGITAATASATITNNLTIAGAPLTVTYVDTEDGYAYFEATGNLAPNAYLIVTTYDNGTASTDVDALVTVEQDAPQPPDVIMPGNLTVLLPSCVNEIDFRWSATITDECDQTITGATFTLGGNPVTPVVSNTADGYFEFEETVGPGADGAVFQASYTDSDGLTTTVDATLQVVDQPDTWAPIIIYPSQNYDIALDPCSDAPGIVSFEITATDNCAGDLTPNVAISGGSLVPGAGNTYIFTAAPGSYTLTITATDAAGNTRTEDFTITFTREPAPLAALVCNDLVNVTLNANCQRVITADMVLEGGFGCYDDDDFTVKIVNDNNPNNGNILDGHGQFIYDVTLASPLLDIMGFTGPFQAANWTLVEDPGPGAGGFADVDITTSTMTLSTLAGFDAIASINMPTDGTVSFDYTYSGTDPNFDFFWVDLNNNRVINVTNPTTGSFSSPVDNGWLLVFHVFDDGLLPIGPALNSEAVITNFRFQEAATGFVGPIDFEHCWGYVKGEDKTDPVITCPPNTGTGTVVKNGYQIAGELDAGDPQIVVDNYSCLIDNTQPNFPGTRYVDVQSFQVDRDDIYTFLLASDVTALGNAAFAIYQGGFDINNPCENIIAQNDVPQGAANPNPGSQVNDPFIRLALPLRAGVTYYIATTSFNPNAVGDYEYAICADNGGRVGFFDTIINVNPVSWDTTINIVFNPFPTAPVTYQLRLFCEDFDLIYNNPASLDITGRPVATDNCDNSVSITFVDTYTSQGDCSDIVITRTFTATDDKGNSTQCVQIITLTRPRLNTNPGLSDVHLPPFTAPVECDEDYPVLPNGNPSPEVTGYPFVVTVSGIFDLNDTYCNLGASFVDKAPIVICDGAYKFFREWSLIDWCNPINSFTYNQIIKVGDFTAPEFTCPLNTDTNNDGIADAWIASTSPFSCTAAFAVPLPQVTDNCSEVEILSQIVTEVEVELFDQYGLPAGTRIDTVVVRTVPFNAPTRIVSGIPLGNHYFRYTIEDGCGNAVVAYCPFEVRDRIEPVAVCDDDLHISIGGGIGTGGLENIRARVFAIDIDEGSWDNCEIDRIEVRRNKFDPINYTCGSTFSPWLPYVDFFCCDIGVEIEIQLRVIDVAGNINTCWLYVTPEDKVRPYCYFPPNTAVDCDDLPYSFDPTDIDQLQELFGTPSAEDNCEAEAQELPPSVDLECGFGRITRRFRAVDIHGNVSSNFCQQRIDVREVHNYEIRFPADAEAICGVVEPDSVIYEEIGCDLLAVNHTDEFFSASGDECYKIFRKWKVINWCQYDGEGDPYVIGRDEDCDNRPGDEAVWVLVRPNRFVYIDRDSDETEPNNVPLAFQNICFGIDDFWRKVDESVIFAQTGSNGFFQYTQIIKVYDDVDPEITADPQEFCSYNNVTCDGLVTFEFKVDENCTPDDLTVKVFLDPFNSGNLIDLGNLTDGLFDDFVLSGTYPDYTITGRFPIGEHAFEVHVQDGCGNVNSELLPFEVVDCKAPSPICINGLAIELMPFDIDGDDVPDEGRMAIWAVDYIVSPMGDCSGPVKYSINRVGDAPNIDSTGMVLTCADTGTLVIEIWAYDAAGNSDFCETYLLVQDNMNICPGAGAAVAGAIATEESNAVEDVEVSLSGQGAASMMTSATGAYSFSGLQEGYDYTVTPQRDGDYLNGVSTFDLVLISKHILGVQPLDSPYKMIAADVNNSESITTLDLIQLRKLILSIETRFSNNTSWRFVKRSYVFPNASNPWFEDFPEVVNINNLPATGISDADFVAVKVGDVTLDAQTNSVQAVEERNVAGVMAFQVADAAVKAGSEYTVAFTAADIASIDGYQATLTFDATSLELVDLIEGVATTEHFGLSQLSEGLIATSWNGKAAANEVLFSLVFRANADGQLSGLMGISSRMVKAEAYNRSGQHLDVAVEFSNGTVATAGFELYQNTPNPFKGETVIGYNLPEDAQVVLKVSDITGKVLKLVRMDGYKGYNQVTVSSNGLPTGVLTYTVETADYTATKKMIIVE